MSYKHLLCEGGVFYDSWILATSNEAKIKKAKTINFKFDSFVDVFVEEIRNMPLKIEIYLFYGLTQLFYLKCHYLHNDCKNAIKNISAYWINKKLAQKEFAAKRKQDLADMETTCETTMFDETRATEKSSVFPDDGDDEQPRKRKRAFHKNRLMKVLRVASPMMSIANRSTDNVQIDESSSVSSRQQKEPQQVQNDQPIAVEQQMEISVENELETLHRPEILIHEDDRMTIMNNSEMFDLRAEQAESNRVIEQGTAVEIANELPQHFESMGYANENLEIESFEEQAAKRSCVSTKENGQIEIERQSIVQPDEQPKENELEVVEEVTNKKLQRQAKKAGGKAPIREANAVDKKKTNRKKRRRRNKGKVYKRRLRIMCFKNQFYTNIFLENARILENEEERTRPSLGLLDSLMESRYTYDFLKTANEKLNTVNFTPAQVIVEETENIFSSTFVNASKRKRASNCALQDIQSDKQQKFINSTSLHVLDQTNLTAGNAASVLVEPPEQLGNSLLLDNNYLQCFNQNDNILLNVEQEFSNLTNENLNVSNVQVGNAEPLIEQQTTKDRIETDELPPLQHIDSLLGYNETHLENNASILHHRMTEDKSEKFFDDELKPIVQETRSNQIKFSELKKGKSRYNVCMAFNYLLYLKKNKKIDLKQRDSKSDIEVTLIIPL